MCNVEYIVFFAIRIYLCILQANESRKCEWCITTSRIHTFSMLENDDVIHVRNIVQTVWITVTGDCLWYAKNHIQKLGKKK